MNLNRKNKILTIAQINALIDQEIRMLRDTKELQMLHEPWGLNRKQYGK